MYDQVTFVTVCSLAIMISEMIYGVVICLSVAIDEVNKMIHYLTLVW